MCLLKESGIWKSIDTISNIFFPKLWLATISIEDLATENGAKYTIGTDAPQYAEKKKIVMGSFRLCSSLLTEGSTGHLAVTVEIITAWPQLWRSGGSQKVIYSTRHNPCTHS